MLSQGPGWGVVSALDQAHQRAVGSLREELGAAVRIGGPSALWIPHISYFPASGVVTSATQGLVRNVAELTAPFRIRTAGLGIFTGSRPVLFLIVVHSWELASLHHRIWQRLGPAALDPMACYRADCWVPHITLGELDPEQMSLPAAIQCLLTRSLAWDIAIDSLEIACGTDAGTQLDASYAFGAMLRGATESDDG